MLRLYVDGGFDDRVILASGLLARCEVWDALDEKWNAVLDAAPTFPYWHASSAWAATKDPFQVAREVREQRENALGDVLRSQRAGITAFNVWMRADVYRTCMEGQIRLPEQLPEHVTATRNQRRDVANAIDWSYLPLLVRLSDIVLQHVRDARLDMRLHFVLERESTTREDVHIADAAKAAIDAHMTEGGGPISTFEVAVGKSREKRPLEMADLYAWCKRRLLSKQSGPRVIALGDHLSEMTVELPEAAVRAWVASSRDVIDRELGP